MNDSTISTHQRDKANDTHRASTPWRNVSKGNEKPLPETILREYSKDEVVLGGRRDEHQGPRFPRFPWPRH